MTDAVRHLDAFAGMTNFTNLNARDFNHPQESDINPYKIDGTLRQ
jgi:hypothetical protein